MAQTKSSIKERQRAMTMDSSLLTTEDDLPTKPKQRSTSFSNTFQQVIGFVQRKLSRTDDDEKQPFVKGRRNH
jgi:hypothetical protein